MKLMKPLIAACVLMAAPVVSADVSLLYEISTPQGGQKQAKIDISGRWLRLEMQPKDQVDYRVFDMGRMLMFEVDSEHKQYQVVRMGRSYWPQNNPLLSPRFRPERKKQSVSGVVCQSVHEMDLLSPDHQEVARHCMAPSGPLKLNNRELITLSRLFMSYRRIGMDWFGVATADERQVSVASEYKSGGYIKLVQADSLNFADYRFRIPPDFQRLQPDLPDRKPDLPAPVKP